MTPNAETAVLPYFTRVLFRGTSQHLHSPQYADLLIIPILQAIISLFHYERIGDFRSSL